MKAALAQLLDDESKLIKCIGDLMKEIEDERLNLILQRFMDKVMMMVVVVMMMMVMMMMMLVVMMMMMMVMMMTTMIRMIKVVFVMMVMMMMGALHHWIAPLRWVGRGGER